MSLTIDQHRAAKKLWASGVSAREIASEIGLDGDDARELILRAIESEVPVDPDSWWTEERTAVLKKLWDEGASATDIAREMRITRNKAGSKIGRLGLTRSHVAITDSFGQVDPNVGRVRPDDLRIPVEQRKTLMQSNASTCHWPVGDPKKPDFFFCGGGAVPGEAYCAGHCRVAYNGRLHRKVA